jgi:hypothetical protein
MLTSSCVKNRHKTIKELIQKTMKTNTVLIVTLLSLFLMGFTMEGPDVPAIFDSLQKTSGSAPTEVMLVHGMGIHTENEWSIRLRDGLAEKLGLSLRRCVQQKIQHDDDPPPADETPVNLNICTYQGVNKTVTFYELTWSMITEPVKRRVLDFDDREYGKERVSINRETKKAVINEGLSDAVLYLTNYRTILQTPFKQAICILLQGIPPQGQKCVLDVAKMETEQGKDLFIITKSLGSAILYDTLREMRNHKSNSNDAVESAEARASSYIIGHTNTVYMLANQIPLLCLGTYSAKSRVCEEKATMDKAQTITNVVAINDPNDLLSYPLKEWQLDFVRLPGAVTNVHIHLATRILGQFANPRTAHSGHEEESDVITMIACGTKHHKLRKCSLN